MGFVSFTCVLIHVINKKIHSIIEFLFTITAHNNILIILIISATLTKITSIVRVLHPKY